MGHQKRHLRHSKKGLAFYAGHKVGWIKPRHISVVLSDGSEVRGKVYSVTHDIWYGKGEKTLNVNLDNSNQTAHFPMSAIKEFRR